jgi:hypothetical protein
MSDISPEILTIAGVGLLILIAIFLVKFGKQILTIVLVLAAIAAVLYLGLPLLGRIDTAGANETLDDAAAIARFLTPAGRGESETRPRPSPGGFGAGFLTGLLTAVGGYFFIRWKLAERPRPRHTHHTAPPPTSPPHASTLYTSPLRSGGIEEGQIPPIVINTDGQEIDTSEWGW